MNAINFTYRKRRPVDLCHLFNHWDGKTIPNGGAMISQKIDGWRCLYFRGLDGKPGLWTRNGFPIEGAGHILHRLALMERAAGFPLFVDGEFQVDGTLLATKTWCESGWKGGGEAGQLFSFDCMPLADWKSGRCDTPLAERAAMLKDLLAASYTLSDDWEWREGRRGDEPATPISVIENTLAKTPIEVCNTALQVWDQGGEGIVVKDPQSPYIRGRSNHWMKVKKAGVR